MYRTVREGYQYPELFLAETVLKQAFGVMVPNCPIKCEIRVAVLSTSYEAALETRHAFSGDELVSLGQVMNSKWKNNPLINHTAHYRPFCS